MSENEKVWFEGRALNQNELLHVIVNQLKRIADALEGRAAVQKEEAPPSEPKEPSYLPAKDLEEALAEYLKLVDVIDIEGKLIIEQIGWIDDKETWRSINKIIKAHGGSWIKGGKESHWEVPK